MTPFQLLKRQQQHIRRYAEVTSVHKMRAFYRNAEKDAELRIRRALRGKKDFEVQHYQALLREIRSMLTEMGEEMATVLQANAEHVMQTSIAQTLQTTKAFTFAAAGIEPRFSLESASVAAGLINNVAPSLLTRYREMGRSSWATSTIKKMEGTISIGLAEGVGSDEIATRIMGREGFAGTRYQADRIARTEAMYCTGQANLMAGRSMAKDMPGLKKKYIATMDNRVSPEHLELHGQIFEWEAMIKDSRGHEAVMPPLRPQCRCTCIPWSDDWKSMRTLEPLTEKRQAKILGG
uniref:Putative capsid morphogenesis protein n=1 Tax=viral metagenome TaxID=1070528 RepID=A0A6H1Z9S4_9ZZZZ